MRAALVLALLVAPLVAPSALASEPTDDARVASAMAWLAAEQDADGSWGSKLGPAYAVEAAGSAMLDPVRWPTPGHPALDALRVAAWSPVDDPTFTEYKADLRALYAVGTAGVDPRDLHGVDLVALARQGFVGNQAGDPSTVNDDVFFVLGLLAAGERRDAQVDAAVQQIWRAQTASGGWSHVAASLTGARPTRAPDTDDTGMALAALAMAGENVRGNADALRFLASVKNATDGGYGYQPGAPSNAQSTAWAIHALAALGQPPDEGARAYLRALQQPDGSFAYAAGDATRLRHWPTVDVVGALATGRWPPPRYAQGLVTADVAPATQGTRLTVSGPFDDALWTTDEGQARGASVSFVFARAGVHEVSVVAHGEGAWRWSGVVAIPSAPPVARLRVAAFDVARHETVSLDLSRSRDPDGVVAGTEVDWGDGNVTAATTHAFARPGDFVVAARVVDDAGLWSEPVAARVHVRNAAPAFAPLPARVVANLSAPLPVAWNATDPDDDALVVTWTFEGANGTGELPAPTRLGNATLRLDVLDPWGANATAEIAVEVVEAPRATTLEPPANTTTPPPANTNRTVEASAPPQATNATEPDALPTAEPEPVVDDTPAADPPAETRQPAPATNATPLATASVEAQPTPDAPAPTPVSPKEEATTTDPVPAAREVPAPAWLALAAALLATPRTRARTGPRPSRRARR